VLCTIAHQHFISVVLLFDIQGFFDNICIDRAVHILKMFGFPNGLCTWVGSFLHDRHIFLSFNKLSSEMIDLDFGTPQGSPLSPILSALYTAPLLHIIESSWKRRGLSLFVDDGNIQSTGVTFRSAADGAARGFKEITGWLARNGLRAEPDKTELIIFAPKHAKPSPVFGPPLKGLALRDPFLGEYVVRPKTSIRYLGVFIDHKLDWSHHNKIMAMRARSTVRSLQILGNSIRGLSFANWRKVFHALIIPVLLYACPVWFTGIRQKKICDMLQIAQNDAIRRISGCFKTTPTATLHSLLSIPPIKYTLHKLRNNYRDRLMRLPPNCRLRTLPTQNTIAFGPSFFTQTTPLTCLHSEISSFPTFCLPAFPSLTHWSHPRFKNLQDKCHYSSSLQLYKSIPADSLFIILRPLSTDKPHFFVSVSTGAGGHVNDCHSVLGANPKDALFKGLMSGLAHLAPRFDSVFFTHLHIFAPPSLSFDSISHLSKHSHLSFSFSFVSFAFNFLSSHRSRMVNLHRLYLKWEGGPESTAHTYFQDRTQRLVAFHPPPPPSNKAKVFADWREDYLSTRHEGPAWVSCTPPESPTPPPFICGVLSTGNRRYFSAAIQLTTRHAFHSWYSDNFRPEAGDNTTCPCSNTQHPVPHSVEHVLLRCPLHSTTRQKIFGPNPSLAFIFETEAGGRKLCDFLHITQALLHPLPPRPDPP
jgi:hypothetical protein